MTTTCFRTLESTVFNVSVTDAPCTGADPTGCCSYGDICLSNGICRYAKPTAVESGYYLQSCTDPTFQSSIGQETLHCTTFNFPDIVYNAATGLWACCSSDNATGVQCSSATNETWAAPAPAALSTIVSIQQLPASSASAVPIPSPPSSISSGNPPTAASSSFVTTTSTNPRPTASPVPAPSSTASSLPNASPNLSPSTFLFSSTSTPSDTLAAATTTTSSAAAGPSSSIHKTSPLSAGAAAGISVGSAIGLVSLISLLFLAFRTTQRRRRQSSAALFGGPDPTSEHLVDPPMVADAATGTGAPYRPPRPPRFTGEPQFPFPLSQETGGGQSGLEPGGRQPH